MPTITNLLFPNPWRDEVEQAMADDTDGNVVEEDVMTFLTGSSVSAERLSYPSFCSVVE